MCYVVVFDEKNVLNYTEGLQGAPQQSQFNLSNTIAVAPAKTIAGMLTQNNIKIGTLQKIDLLGFLLLAIFFFTKKDIYLDVC